MTDPGPRRSGAFVDRRVTHHRGRRLADSGRTGAGRWHDLHRPVRALVWLLMLLVVVMLYRQTQVIVDRVIAVLLLFVFAAIVAMLLTPLVDRVEQLSFMKGRRPLAVLAVNVLILVALAALGMAIAPSLVSQGGSFAKQMPLLFDQVQSQVNSWEGSLNQRGIPFHLAVPSDLGSIAAAVFGSAVGIITGTLATVVNILIIAVIAIYLQIQGRELIDFARRLFPEQQELIDFSVVASGTTLASYVRGQLIMALVLSAYTGITLQLIGVHYALVIAVGTFLLELIPLAGAPIAMVIITAFAFFQGPVPGVLAMATTLVGHTIGAYTIGLRIIGRSARVHPLVALGAMLMGASLGGVLGALFAVPIAGIINVYLGALYRTRRGEQAFSLPEGTDTAMDQLPGLGDVAPPDEDSSWGTAPAG